MEELRFQTNLYLYAWDFLKILKQISKYTKFMYSLVGFVLKEENYNW